MSSPLPYIDPFDASQGWSDPCKRIYSANEVVSFRKSIAIDRIQSALYLICSKVSLVDVPKGALDDSLVAFEHATHPGVATSNRPRPRHNPHPTPAFPDLPPPESPNFSRDELSPSVRAVLSLLDELKSLLDSTPPFPGPRRYGNMACRDWHDKLTDSVDGWLMKYIGEPLAQKAHKDANGLRNTFFVELSYYFLGSFGSRERLDFGTGHELSFLAFLASLLMANFLSPAEVTGRDYLIMFSAYYDFIRTLILTYTLEPAGSHGVWGLDDHFHLIYILGACQMVEFDTLNTTERSERASTYRMRLTPQSVLNNPVVKRNRTRNLFYNAIAFIKKVKFGPFNEHSPLLYEVCTSKSWEKIAKGMLKMYYGEVLGKFPVVQHFFFGHVLFPWIDRDTDKLLPEVNPEEEEISVEVPQQTIMPKMGTASANFSSTVTSAQLAMNSLYDRREQALTKLHDARLKKNEAPTSRDARR